MQEGFGGSAEFWGLRCHLCCGFLVQGIPGQKGDPGVQGLKGEKVRPALGTPLSLSPPQLSMGQR